MASKGLIASKGIFVRLVVPAVAVAILLGCLHFSNWSSPREQSLDNSAPNGPNSSEPQPSAGTGSTTASRNQAGIRERLQQDASAGRPLIVHLVVALCDNRYQGIVPVPEQLGNGQDPRNNLYWGAMYGVRSFMTRNAGWQVVAKSPQLREGILEKIVLYKAIGESSRNVEVYVVAEAWDGKRIRSATERFLRMTAGQKPENIKVETANGFKEIRAGGSSHLIAYVGHNGLMDFSLDAMPSSAATARPRSAVVLACKSKPYFQKLLKHTGAHALLLTTGLMAPEAYTLDAAIRSWAIGQEPDKVRDSAAQAYHKYQKCGLQPAKNLFFAEPYPTTDE